jgi:hypothetical protein
MASPVTGLDLDHVGAEIAEDHRAERPREVLAQVDDADAGERDLAGGAVAVARDRRAHRDAPAPAIAGMSSAP